MKIVNYILLISFLTLPLSHGIAQVCSSIDTLRTQEDVDSFRLKYGTCDTIIGNLVIDGGDDGGDTAVVNLDSLAGITTITGSLKLTGLDSIVDISALLSLTTVGDSLELIGNDVLSDMTGLDNITSVGGRLFVCCTGALTSPLEHLGSVVTVGGELRVCCSGSFTNTAGMDALTTVGGNVDICCSGGLTEVNGFPSLVYIGDSLRISAASNIQIINGFQALKWIGNGLRIQSLSSLTTITGFSSLDSVGGNVTLSNLPSLTKICGLYTLLDNVDDGSAGPGGTPPDVGGSVIFNNSGAFTSLADVVAAGPCAIIPALSEWGLFLFGLIVFTVALVAGYNLKIKGSKSF